MEYINKLQFLHHPGVFATVEEAKAYVYEQIEAQALIVKYGEPLVLAYGSSEEPNILLGIGSKEEETGVFFIDSSSHEALIEQVENIIKSCGFDEKGIIKEFETACISDNTNLFDAIESLAAQHTANVLSVSDTNSVHLKLEESSEGKNLSAELNVPQTIVIGRQIVDNQIVVNRAGVSSYVDLEYQSDDNKLILQTNTNKKEIDLGNPIEKGEYDVETETIILTLCNGNQVSIDCEELIGEWMIQNEPTSAVVLKKQNVKYDQADVRENKHADVLSADVKIAPRLTHNHNILQKDNNGNLFVDGLGDNITVTVQGKPTTLQEVVNQGGVASTSDGNIIYSRADGLFAKVDLSYDKETNTLYLTKSLNDEEHRSETTEIKLNDNSIFGNKLQVTYDKTTEELVVVYYSLSGERQELRIPVSDLFDEWDVDNEEATITLVKTRDIPGVSTLKANVNVAPKELVPNNILEEYHSTGFHGLAVVGEASKIAYKDSNVKEALEDLEDKQGKLTDALDKEIERATTADNDASSKIEVLSSSTSELSSQVTELKEQVESQEGQTETLANDIINLTEDLQQEISRSVNADNEIRSGLQNLNNKMDYEIERVDKQIETESARLEHLISDNSKEIENLSDHLDAEIERATTKENAIESELTEVSTKVNAVETKLETEITRVEHLIDDAEEHIDNVANDVAGAKVLITDNTLKINELSAKTASLTADVAQEVARATAKENELKDTLDQLLEDVEAALEDNNNEHKELRQAIANNVLSVKDDNVVSLNLSDNIAGGKMLSGKINLNADTNNILEIEQDGLKASVSLTYSEATNELVFDTSALQEPQRIQLVGVSVIDTIVYDSLTETLVLTYHVSGTVEPVVKEVKIPVSAFFKPLIADNTNKTATAILGVNESGNQTISVNVNIADALPDNLLKKVSQGDGNALYVDGSEIKVVKAKTEELEESLNTLAEVVETKQNQLTAGDNIVIEDDIISAIIPDVDTHYNASWVLTDGGSTRVGYKEFKKISATTDIEEGKEYLFVVEKELADSTISGSVSSDMDNSYIRCQSGLTIEDSTVTSAMTAQYQFRSFMFEKAPNNVDGWYPIFSEKYLSSTGLKSLRPNAEKSEAVEFRFKNVDEKGLVTIDVTTPSGSSNGKLLYNVSSPRFLNYGASSSTLVHCCVYKETKQEIVPVEQYEELRDAITGQSKIVSYQTATETYAFKSHYDYDSGLITLVAPISKNILCTVTITPQLEITKTFTELASNESVDIAIAEAKGDIYEYVNNTFVDKSNLISIDNQRLYADTAGVDLSIAKINNSSVLNNSNNYTTVVSATSGVTLTKATTGNTISGKRDSASENFFYLKSTGFGVSGVNKAIQDAIATIPTATQHPQVLTFCDDMSKVSDTILTPTEYYFTPDGKIRKYDADLTVLEEMDPIQTVIYCERLSNLQYRWNGSEMVLISNYIFVPFLSFQELTNTPSFFFKLGKLYTAKLDMESQRPVIHTTQVPFENALYYDLISKDVYRWDGTNMVSIHGNIDLTAGDYEGTPD